MNKVNSQQSAKFSQIALGSICGFLLALLLLGSRTLAFPFALLGASLPLLLAKRRADRRRAALATIWPELLDHMISGLRSGLSIAETLTSLATRGPEIARPIFVTVERELRNGMDIGTLFKSLKFQFNDPIADQVCEVLDFARGTGSRDTALTLRTLGDFIRSDIAVRGEIKAKLGWVKNSAIVAAIAPWILLVILSAQPSTVEAFSTPTGIVILIVGVLMSFIAYLWMGRVGRIPEIPRIFGEIKLDDSQKSTGKFIAKKFGGAIRNTRAEQLAGASIKTRAEQLAGASIKTRAERLAGDIEKNDRAERFSGALINSKAEQPGRAIAENMKAEQPAGVRMGWPQKLLRNARPQ
jgi:tight adherence protein B